MSSNLVEFVITGVIESHDTSVTSLCCSSLADDSDTTGYHFLTSVIKTVWEGGIKNLTCSWLLHSIYALNWSGPETSCSQSETWQSCRLHSQAMKAATHMYTLIYGLPFSDAALTWSQNNWTDFGQEQLDTGLPQCSVLNSTYYDGVRHDFCNSHRSAQLTKQD